MIGGVRVAVGQFASSRDKPRNLEKATEAVHAAAAAGAALVVLPEAAMYPFGRPEDGLLDAAEPVDGPFAAALVEVARQTGVTVVAGMFEAVPGERRVSNTVLAVGPDGMLGHYRKLHLFDALGWRESDRVRPGHPGEQDALLTFDLGGLTVGVLTCYDLRFPELTRALVDAGATVLAVPAAWVHGPLKEYQWRTLAAARAIENVAYLVAADQSPPEFAGHSMVIDPMGVVLAQVGDVDGLAVAEVSASRLAEVRRVLPVLEHRRYAVVPAGDRGEPEEGVRFTGVSPPAGAPPPHAPGGVAVRR
jgi:predicted amidohydrolase